MSLLCRTCGEDIDTSDAKNVFAAEQKEIVNNVFLLTGILLTDDLNLSHHICVYCELKLTNAMNFRNRCLQTHSRWVLEKGGKAETQEMESEVLKNAHEDNNSIETDTDRTLAYMDPLTNKESLSTALRDEDDADFVYLATEERKEDENKSSSPTSSIDLNIDFNESKKLHMKRDKMRTQNYYCDQCGKHFNDRSNLRLHLVRHTGIKEYKCPECNRKEFNYYLLKLHIRVKHRGEKPFACKYCGECFVNSAKRCRHQRSHETLREKVKPYACGFCGQTYESKSTLKKHEIIHSGERPYECEICNVAFNRKSNLQTHFRSKFHKKKEEAPTEMEIK